MNMCVQNTWIKFFIIVGFLSALCLVPAVAQEQKSVVEDKASYSNDQLESFVIANVGIYKLQQKVIARMSDMESDQQKQELMHATNHQAEQILQNAGLTVDQYNTMGQTVESNVQLREKVNLIASDLYQQEEDR